MEELFELTDKLAAVSPAATAGVLFSVAGEAVDPVEVLYKEVEQMNLFREAGLPQGGV